LKIKATINGWQGYDEFTDNITIPDSIKIALYIGSPSVFGAYHGFAPLD